MKYLLDSNVVIAAMDGTNALLRARMAARDEGDLATSSIVYAEVALGSFRGKGAELALLERLLVHVPVLSFDRAAALAYAGLQFERDRLDHLIAAHAISLGLTVVSDNERHFARLPGVRVENWMR